MGWWWWPNAHHQNYTIFKYLCMAHLFLILRGSLADLPYYTILAFLKNIHKKFVLQVNNAASMKNIWIRLDFIFFKLPSIRTFIRAKIAMMKEMYDKLALDYHIIVITQPYLKTLVMHTTPAFFLLLCWVLWACSSQIISRSCTHLSISTRKKITL